MTEQQQTFLAFVFGILCCAAGIGLLASIVGYFDGGKHNRTAIMWGALMLIIGIAFIYIEFLVLGVTPSVPT